MPESVQLLGLDFGTTTSSAVVARASLRRTATGRMELDRPEETFRSEMVFTPLTADDRLDLPQVEQLLDRWIEAGQVEPRTLFGGGALLTGLTAQRENAAGLVDLIRRRLGHALIATADDPCLESWLSFMGSCAALARRHADKFIVNLDIGGGTTNLALGQDRQVLRTGCYYLGARHVQVVPGTYRLVKLSSYARAIFAHLAIDKSAGDDLTKQDVERFLDFCVAILEAMCVGRSCDLSQTMVRETVVAAGTGHRPVLRGGSEIVKALEQAPFRLPTDVSHPILTFSGGVGELIYNSLQGLPWPTTTQFGDLGIDLAQRIIQSPILATSLTDYRPASAGRATVYGLLQHTTEVSGSTLFLPSADMLPLVDLPIFGRLHADLSDEQIRDVFFLMRGSDRGGCVQVTVGSQQAAAVRSLGERVARRLDEAAFPPARPFVMLVQENVGKILGQYVTRWGASPRQILVIDEVPLRDAHYVQIGMPQHQIVPVSFYGLK